MTADALSSNRPIRILPGGVIGIVGGGQLGRMFGIAARRMGYRVHAFDPTEDCPAGQVADVEINRPFDDIDAARDFARGVDVITFEFENVPAATLRAIEHLTPVRPRPQVLEICRNRLQEKNFLRDHGLPHARWHEVHDGPAVAAATEELGGSGILKTALFGYDGKGQVRLSGTDQAADAWAQLDGGPAVVEQIVSFDCEVSAIVARGQDGTSGVFPIGRNDHRNQILDVTTVPAGLPARIVERAEALGREVAEALDVVGVIAVEMFVVGDDLLINELAPRTHNSGHWTFDGCLTSQFEQQLRAVCGLPLGSTRPLADGIAMANLLGDLWQAGEPDWARLLAFQNVKLHLYGKMGPKPGRKMGHLVAMADTPEAARRDVLAAREALKG